MAIHFEEIKYFYNNNKNAILKDINLCIKSQDEFIAVIGKVGSGKSTLVQLMNALLITNIGRLIVFNNQINSKTKQDVLVNLKKQVGLVFQFPEFQLFEVNILKDAMFAPLNFTNDVELAKHKAVTALNRVGISEKFYEKSPFQISSGEQRRVAIAGILAMEPDILVLDEPTRGLDYQSQNHIMDFFQELHQKENKTVIMITHDMDLVVKYANRILLLDEGCIIFDGSKENLFENKNFSNFHLEYPTTLKILKYLNQAVGIPFQYHYCFESLLSYLRQFYL